MNSRFWTFLTAEGVGALGAGFGLIGLGWMVYTLTGSKLAMGLLLTAGLVPEVLVRLFGAPLIDRVHRARLMALLDLLQCLAYLLPVLLELAGRLSLWHLYAVSMVAGGARALYVPAFISLLPTLIDHRSLTRANTVAGAVLQVASLGGPGLAGLLVTYSGARLALAVNAAALGLCGLLLLSLSARTGDPQAGQDECGPQAGLGERGPRTGLGERGLQTVRSESGPQTVRGESGGYLRQLGEGFRFFDQLRVLLVVLVALTFCNAGFMAVQAMQIPFVSEVLGGGASSAGLLASAYPSGFIIGLTTAGLVSMWVPRRLIMLGTLLTWGLLQAGLGLLGPGQLPAAIALYAAIGMTNALFVSHSDLIYQTVVPDHLRSRVQSVRVLVAWSGRPVGSLAGALLAQSLGLRATFLLAGLVPAALVLATFFLPLMRQLDGEFTVGAVVPPEA